MSKMCCRVLASVGPVPWNPAMRTRSLLILVIVLLTAAWPAAVAGQYKVKHLQAISGPSPFPAGCPRLGTGRDPDRGR